MRKKNGFNIMLFVFIMILLMNLSCSENIKCDNLNISHGCTVFTISKGGHVFFGGNDDYINPDSCYWVDPGYAVIISAGADGEVVFTRKRSGDGFLVSINFNVVDPP